MAFFVTETPKRSNYLAETLAPALGQSLGKMTTSYFANKELEKIISDKDLQKKPLSERMEALMRLDKFGPVGQEIVQRRLGLEQQRAQEQEQAKAAKGRKALAQKFGISPEEAEGLTPEQIINYQKAITEKEKVSTRKKQAGNIKNALVKAGYPEETAGLWQDQMIATDSLQGQSDVLKNVNDLLRRSKLGKGITGEETQTNTLKPTIQIPGIDQDELELDFPDIPEPIGLTPADEVKLQNSREGINTPLYAETVDTLNALDEDFRDLQHLQKLNMSENLPTGLEKWNVNWDTGDLRFPALSTPESQSYVKTIARMLGHAKDFFPGRVTNFDLESFRRRFPTLANSPEGRNLIAKELELANRIAYLREETLKAAIDHYGSRADPVKVRQIANENYRNLKGKLEEQLKDLDNKSENFAIQPTKIPVEEAKTLEDLFP